ncbi:MAG TPA: glycoside hydrolase family 36 protein [Pseudonocardiaceae bacterium]
MTLTLTVGHVRLTEVAPLVDGEVPACGPPVTAVSGVVAWPLAGGGRVEVAAGPGRLDVALRDLPPERAVDSVGVRFGRVTNVARFLCNGYTSWDGSRFRPAGEPATGHAMTALVSRTGGTTVLGFERHDRFQSRLRFHGAPFGLDAETLVDRVPHRGEVRAERLLLLDGDGTEDVLRAWARLVAAASPLPPRAGPRRISGWCSWYGLYASISEPVLREYLAAAARFRAEHALPPGVFDVFQVDDGFTPEMGDWLDVRPTFPRGLAPLLAEVRAAGFTPGLWIAPFLVGNRSRLAAEHPDWLVRRRDTGEPHVCLSFPGEFRWHKRSEEYHVLDVTHPDAEEYLRTVLRTWRHEWGCGYLKTDFLHVGTDHGPDTVAWHRPGLSRVGVWARLASIVRSEFGEGRWLGCGAPLWASVGHVDAVRIGRDVGVAWSGAEQSARSLLRDQATRNFANGILWQADPDCVLLRSRHHALSGDEVRSLVLHAGQAGGVLMTSDQLDEVPPERRALFASLLSGAVLPCDFPLLGGEPDPVLLQRVRRPDGTVVVTALNTGEEPVDRLLPWSVFGLDPASGALVVDGDPHVRLPLGVEVTLAAHASAHLLLRPA